MRPRSDLERVRSTWQMASVAHFLETFREILPLKDVSEDAAEDITPELLERAVAQPEVDTHGCLVLRDVIICLLVVIGQVSRKNMHESWFESLRVFVSGRRAEFMDCFMGNRNVLEHFTVGMDFLVGVGWNVRLGLLLGLCDVAAEEGQLVREAIRESEMATTTAKSDLEVRGYRLPPIGRCSSKRCHYKVGKTRIYSGYKRKGSGAVLVECSDSQSMRELAEALANIGHARDQVLATKIQDQYLQPLLEMEERGKRKMVKKRLEEINREESRRRNAVRPRRSKASYL